MFPRGERAQAVAGRQAQARRCLQVRMSGSREPATRVADIS